MKISKRLYVATKIAAGLVAIEAYSLSFIAKEAMELADELIKLDKDE